MDCTISLLPTTRVEPVAAHPSEVEEALAAVQAAAQAVEAEGLVGAVLALAGKARSKSYYKTLFRYNKSQ